ncbi:MAG TPA: hypothetical protein PKW66_11250, partial [Polyangiaceae bacterium]|nr:hypothetical protein [Polyangiaceae bacterium]
ELRREMTGVSYDALPCARATRDSLDDERLAAFAAKVAQPLSDQLLQTLEIIVPTPRGLLPSNGGLILFATDSERDGATGGTRREDVVAAECATADGGGDFVAKAQGPTRVMAGRAPTGSWREKSM